MKISFAFAATCLLTQVVYAARKSASASFDAVAEPSASAAQINKQVDDLYQKIATAQNPKYLSAHVAAVKDFVASMKATVASMKSSANSKKHQHPVSSMASFSLKATAKPKVSTSVKAFGISKGKKRAGSSMVSVVSKASAHMATAISKVSLLQASAATKKNRRAISSMASASKVSVVSKRNKRAASSRASASVKNQKKRAASSMASASVKAFALPKASASMMKRAISSMASASISAAKPSASVVKRAEQFVSGKAEAPQPSFATNQEPELDETSEEAKSDIEEQDPFWIDDEEAEVQFKGYDWSVLQ